MPRFLSSVMGLSVVIAGCVSTGPASEPQDGQTRDDIYFLREKPNDAPDLLAPLEGKLDLSKGCLSIQSADGGTSYTAIWPLEFDFNTGSGSVNILNGDDQVVARVGDQIRVSGGEARLSPEEFEENVIGTAQCSELYWRVNSDVKVVNP